MIHGLFLDLPKFKDYRLKVERHSTKRFPVLNMDGKTEIAIHHSLTRRGLSGANAEGFARYHVNANGWPSIGYSYVIEPDGTIKFCNPINWRTYHVGNSNNFSIGICLTGDFRYEEPTDEQKESLRLLVARLKKEYSQIKRVRSHNEYPDYTWKRCCEFDYKKVLSEKVAEIVGKDLGSTYKVQEGDTFWSIAKGRDFEVVDLEHANPKLDPRALKIGQVINIPTDENKATEDEKKSTKYHGNSIEKYLESIGEDGSYSARKKLAEEYGIKNYKGTADQNILMLSIHRDGKEAPTNKQTPVNIRKGQKVTVPAGKLYAQGNASKPVSNSQLTATVETVYEKWLNPVRLINSKGVYVGFARLNDLKGDTTPKAKERKPKQPSYIGKRVESIHDGQLRFYDKPSWNNRDVVGTVKKGWGFTKILDKVKVGTGEQYKVQNSRGQVYYITAASKFVKVV